MACILLVDDDRNLREGMRLLLERRGHRVVEAENGRKALSRYREQTIDLVITDILMPEKDGMELILELRRDVPDVKIIAISGGYSSGDGSLVLDTAKGLGALLVLTKPFPAAELHGAIAKLLEAS